MKKFEGASSKGWAKSAPNALVGIGLNDLPKFGVGGGSGKPLVLSLLTYGFNLPKLF